MHIVISYVSLDSSSLYFLVTLLFSLSVNMFFFFYCYGVHRDLHLLTPSFPTRRSSDLLSACSGRTVHCVMAGALASRRTWWIVKRGLRARNGCAGRG